MKKIIVGDEVVVGVEDLLDVSPSIIEVSRMGEDSRAVIDYRGVVLKAEAKGDEVVLEPAKLLARLRAPLVRLSPIQAFLWNAVLEEHERFRETGSLETGRGTVRAGDSEWRLSCNYDQLEATITCSLTEEKRLTRIILKASVLGLASGDHNLTGIFITEPPCQVFPRYVAAARAPGALYVAGEARSFEKLSRTLESMGFDEPSQRLSGRLTVGLMRLGFGARAPFLGGLASTGPGYTLAAAATAPRQLRAPWVSTRGAVEVNEASLLISSGDVESLLSDLEGLLGWERHPEEPRLLMGQYLALGLSVNPVGGAVFTYPALLFEDPLKPLPPLKLRGVDLVVALVSPPLDKGDVGSVLEEASLLAEALEALIGGDDVL